MNPNENQNLNQPPQPEVPSPQPVMPNPQPPNQIVQPLQSEVPQAPMPPINHEQTAQEFSPISAPPLVNGGIKSNVGKISITQQILNFFVIAGSMALGYILGLAYFVVIIPILIGVYLPKIYTKKSSGQTIANITAWSNVLTWILPFLGLYTAAATLSTAGIYREKSTKYYILGGIGLALSLINGILGVMIRTGKINF